MPLQIPDPVLGTWTKGFPAHAAGLRLSQVGDADLHLSDLVTPVLTVHEGALAHNEETVFAWARERPWPLREWPDVSTRVVVFSDDRFFPSGFLRDLAATRLGLTADELPGGHCAMLSHPVEIADLLCGDAG